MLMTNVGREVVKRWGLAAVALFVLSGCSARIGDFTMVSTHNVALGEKYEKVGTAEGSSGGFFQNPDMKLAVDKALRAVSSDAVFLTNARIFSETWPVIPYSKIKVTGDAWAPIQTSRAGDVEGYHLETSDAGTFLVSEDGSDRVEVMVAP